MKSIFKKISSCVVALCLVVGSMFLLAGCGETEDPDARVMNVSVNPKLEFVLDEDDKVVSVSALNDDGECLLQVETDVNAFVGMSAEEASKKFLDLAKQYGFVVEADTNKLTISISGEGADKLLNDVKSSVETYMTDVLNLNLTVKNEKINREYLESVVANCYQEYTNAQIDKMSEEDLIELIEKSREETKELLTQDLKEMYYVERARDIMTSKIQEIETQATSSLNAVKIAYAEAAKQLYNVLDNIYATIENAYSSLKASINTKMEEYVALKQEYLEARIEGVEFTKSAELLAAEEALDTMREQVLESQAVQDVISGLEQAKQSVINKINEIMEHFDEDEIETAVETAKTNLINTYKTAVENKNAWVAETPAA